MREAPPLSSLMRIWLRGRRSGVVMLLEGYYDDSGTHNDSSVVVWGGLFGPSERWEYLDNKWRELLAKPPHGRPPLKQFHLALAAARKGEFIDYSEAESDHVRWAFRELIIEAGLEGVGFALSTVDWRAIVRGRLKKIIPYPELICAGACVRWAFERTEDLGEEFLVLTFDQGRLEMVPGVADFINKAVQAYRGKVQPIDVAFHAVAKTPALQAADTIATETYWWAKTRYAGTPELSAHFKSLLGKVHVSGNVIDRTALEDIVRSLNRTLSR